uniref:Uncharacterized protein n=1 Tax=Anguilla anguilla TaxID=7936 RepID=A0A0E9UZX5_ANGAN
MSSYLSLYFSGVLLNPRRWLRQCSHTR